MKQVLKVKTSCCMNSNVRIAVSLSNTEVLYYKSLSPSAKSQNVFFVVLCQRKVPAGRNGHCSKTETVSFF